MSKKTALIIGVTVSLLVRCAAASGAQPVFSFAFRDRPAEVTVYYGGQKMLVYAFEDSQYKPYVKELYTLPGYNVLRDAVPDHPHHHGLMYAITVNGVNFWGVEGPECGIEKPVKDLRCRIEAGPEGRSQATIAHTIHWLAPQDRNRPDTAAAALLLEQRTLTLSVNQQMKEVALRWEGTFTVGPKTNQVVLTGSNYHGLGVRFLQELDPFAEVLNARSRPDLSGTKQDVSRAPWAAVLFLSKAKPATLAVFGQPENPRGEAWYFTMRTPFTYLSATQNLDKEPLTYKAGDSFRLRYVVALYPIVQSPEFITRRGQALTRSK